MSGFINIDLLPTTFHPLHPEVLSVEELRRGVLPAFWKLGKVCHPTARTVHGIVEPPQIWVDLACEDLLGWRGRVSLEDDYLENRVQIRLLTDNHVGGRRA